MADTIAAIATALRPSAIGIVRVSGPGAYAAVDRAFRARSGQSAAQRRCRAASYGSMLDPQGRIIDDGLCILFPEGGSYTGEPSAELYCHGSPVVLEQVLLSLFAGGARQAAGGEFTKRAFLSGRMDLIQAEAVADLIDAETAEEARNAAGQLSGSISRQVQQVYDRLMEVLSRFYAAVDYPDEEIEPDAGGEPADAGAAPFHLSAGPGLKAGHSHGAAGAAQRGEKLPVKRPGRL